MVDLLGLLVVDLRCRKATGHALPALGWRGSLTEDGFLLLLALLNDQVNELVFDKSFHLG